MTGHSAVRVLLRSGLSPWAGRDPCPLVTTGGDGLGGDPYRTHCPPTPGSDSTVGLDSHSLAFV